MFLEYAVLDAFDIAEFAVADCPHEDQKKTKGYDEANKHEQDAKRRIAQWSSFRRILG